MKKRFHRKLSTGGWSMKTSQGRVEQIESAYLQSVRIHQPNLSSKKVQLTRYQGGKRSVFAWFWSNRYQVGSLPPIPQSAQRVRYNPREDDWFHINGSRVDRLSQVWLTPSGECWAIQ